MKKFFTPIIFSLLFFLSFSLNAQVNTSSQWTWMNGASTKNQPAVYGTKGIADVNNTPGSRWNSITWTDASGNLWLYGGEGYTGTISIYFRDLWKYNPVTNQWTWVSGSNTQPDNPGVYGTKGVPAASNTPGARVSSSSWTDASGNFWLFGGGGYGYVGTPNGQTAFRVLNDLWKYDPATDQWTWISGTMYINQQGVYGTKGIADANNMPSAKMESVSWTDAAGNFWLFGGYSNEYLNDLWKYDPTINQWTWVSGSNTVNQLGIYGTKGVAASSNTPGARYQSVSWSDPLGNLWLFGGSFYNSSTGVGGTFNDLWKFDPGTNLWTWVNGSNITDEPGVYGTKGVISSTNVPGARVGGVSWSDNSGNLWLFGGTFRFPSNHKNDLWKYEPATNQWTWISGSNIGNQPGIYGTKGVPDASNTPGARHSSASWKDVLGNFWLFGGVGYDNTSVGYLNDLWKFGSPPPPATTTTTVTSSINPSTLGQSLTFTATVTSASGTPTGTVTFFDGGTSIGTVTLSGNTATFTTSALTTGSHSITATYNGNATHAASTSSVLTQFVNAAPPATTTTTITSSNNPSTFGQSVTFTATVATASGTPTGTVTFFDGATNIGSGTLSGNTATYTTSALSVGSHNITSVYSGNSNYATSTSSVLIQVVNTVNTTPICGQNQWTWVSGSNTINQAGIYGTKGIESAANIPGARFGSVKWTDAAGNLWLFGGSGYSSSGNGRLNDLWKYNSNTNQWTWVSGSNTIGQAGIYGTKGTASVLNIPGARDWSVSWTDASGNFWLFGGDGIDVNGNLGVLNDLWKYEPVTKQWTWVNGSNISNQGGVYGTVGTAASSNVPGGRSSAVSWIDLSGNFWLFGGDGEIISNNAVVRLNDLWKYNPATNQWTWVSGSNSGNQPGDYGTIGISTATNVPGARRLSVSWTDNIGNLWMFGGNGYGNSSTNAGDLNDLWKYNPTTNQWTWVSGSNTINPTGIYGTKGTTAATNVPGGRTSSGTWKDPYGNLWLFGGDNFGVRFFNDVWKYDPTLNQWTWIAGANTTNQKGIYGTKGIASSVNTPGARTSRLTWIDATGNVWLFGGLGYDMTNIGSLNDLWKFSMSTVPTNTSVISSLNPSTFGQSVTFTATVTTSCGTLTGTVSFYDGATLLGTGTLSGNTATYSTTALSVGPHNITAVYGGNSNYATSTSSVLTEVVNAAPPATTTTTITSSVNPSTFGQSVTFTATVSTATGTPTGTVSFYDGATLLGNGTLSGNTATFATSALAVGSHNITAVYGGNASNSTSTSFTLIQVVKFGNTGSTGSRIRIYPNPVTNSIIQFHFINMPQGDYITRLVNNLGQTVLTKNLNNVSGNSTETMQISKLLKGVYYVEVIKPDKYKNTFKVIIY
jgi:hypothetical protein